MRPLFATVLGALSVAVHAADPLLTSDQLARTLNKNLPKPLPTIESIVGVPIPSPAPLMVIASFGDDGAVADQDRGYAVGATLRELLFDADPRLDVLAPWYYDVDVRGKDVPSGFKRDSAANADRVAARDATDWCAHGRVTGKSPVKVEFVVDKCAADKSSHKRLWTVNGDAEWPATLAEMCEFASASATGELTSRAKASCQRARDIRPASFLGFARYGIPKYHVWATLDEINKADPKFATVVVEYLEWMPYSNWNEFWNRVGVLAQGAPQSSAVKLAGFYRLARTYGWKISMRPYPEFKAWVRDHAYLSSAWLELASALSAGNPADWPEEQSPPPLMPDGFPVVEGNKTYPRNEATHNAALALSLGVYRVWPKSYRSLWQMGYSLKAYAWMLRGSSFWSDVPKDAKRVFPGFIAGADRFIDAALALNPESAGLWENKLVTAKLAGDDWHIVFKKAVEVSPNSQSLYETAIVYALDRWGGNAETRAWIVGVARKNNPQAEWAKTLPERMKEKYQEQNF